MNAGPLSVPSVAAGLDAALAKDYRHVSGSFERFLIEHGECVVRVATRLSAEARRAARHRGKSDSIDALAVARAAVREGLEDLPAAQLAGPELDLRLPVDHRNGDERNPLCRAARLPGFVPITSSYARSWVGAIVGFGIGLLAHLPRIYVEEAALSRAFGADYTRYASRTARLFPRAWSEAHGRSAFRSGTGRTGR